MTTSCITAARIVIANVSPAHLQYENHVHSFNVLLFHCFATAASFLTAIFNTVNYLIRKSLYKP